jgi:hypothetical protein
MNAMTPIFTRYLYYKNDVVLSLIICILKKDIEKSLFWGYELYYSGFTQEVMDIVMFVYKEFYKNLPLKIKSFIKKKFMAWKQDMTKDSLLATLIHNLASRKPDLALFYNKYSGSPFCENKNIKENKIVEEIKKEKKIIYAIYQDSDIEKYKTIETTGLHARHVLKKACEYSTIKNAYSLFESFQCSFLRSYSVNINREELRKYYFYHWEYCAFYTPIWKERIEKYIRKVNNENKNIDFMDDEKKELFYHSYGYEPDENPREITEKTVGYEKEENNIKIKKIEDFVSYIENIS